MNTENRTSDNDNNYCSIIFSVESFIDINELIFKLRGIFERRAFNYSIHSSPDEQIILTVKFNDPNKKSYFDRIIRKLMQAQLSFDHFYEPC